MGALRAEGHSLRHLLECSGLRRSTYYYALAHPRRPTRPELRDAAAEIFSRTANGCGHRQIAMCLRAELGAVVADKTVLKMMREMGIRCGIRRRGSRRRYSSYRGLVGSTFENVIARDFGAEGPWQKLGTVSVNIFFTIFTNVFSPIAPTRMRRIRQRGCAAFGV